MIMIANSSGFPEQFTVHRPIGITDCHDDDWVMTRTCDVTTLLARKKDPRQGEIQVQQNKNRTELLITKGHLVKKGEDVYYKDHLEHTRNEFLDAAEKKLNVAKKEQKAPPKATRAAYLEPNQMAAETAIQEFLKTPEAVSAIKKNAEQTFRTRGGVLEDQPQLAIAALKGKTLREVQATLTKLVYQTIGLGQNVTVTVVTGNTNPPTRQDSDSEEEEDVDYQSEIQRLTGLLADASATLAQIHIACNALQTSVDSVAPGQTKSVAQHTREVMTEVIHNMGTLVNNTNVKLSAPGGT